MNCLIRLPGQWVNASKFETALRRSGGPHDANTNEVVVEIPEGCKIMVDPAVRLLSLANQLAAATKRVRLSFEEGQTGILGYPNRVGFFDHLAGAFDLIVGTSTGGIIACALAAGIPLTESVELYRKHPRPSCGGFRTMRSTRTSARAQTSSV